MMHKELNCLCRESPITPASLIPIALVCKLYRKVISCSYIRRYYAEFNYETQYREISNFFCSVLNRMQLLIRVS